MDKIVIHQFLNLLTEILVHFVNRNTVHLALREHRHVVQQGLQNYVLQLFLWMADMEN